MKTEDYRDSSLGLGNINMNMSQIPRAKTPTPTRILIFLNFQVRVVGSVISGIDPRSQIPDPGNGVFFICLVLRLPWRVVFGFGLAKTGFELAKTGFELAKTGLLLVSRFVHQLFL